MRELKVVSFLAVLALLVASCSAATPAGNPDAVTTVPSEGPAAPPSGGLPATEADVPRVSLEEALTAIQSGQAVLVDVRSAQAYQVSRAAGAISIPLAEIETNPGHLSLDKERWIITYCT